MRLAILILFAAVGAHADVLKGTLTAETGRDGVSNYFCQVVLTPVETHDYRLSLDRASRELKITLPKGHKVRGYAAEVVSADEKEAQYFMTNGFWPYHFRFTLQLKNEGNWARLTLVEGAREIVCEKN